MRSLPLGLLLLATACTNGAGALLPPSSDGGSAPEDAGVTDSGGPVPMVAEPFQSGARLRAQLWDAGGGARKFLAWYDTVLGVPCKFDRAGDGEFYCLPLGRDSTFFADTNCTEPALWVDDCPLVNRFVRATTWSGLACGYPQVTDPRRQVAVYEVVGEEPVDSLNVGTPNVCVPEVRDSGRAYRLQPVSLATMVHGSLVLEPRGDGLAVWSVHTEDGAREDLTSVDTARQEECSPVLGLDQCLNAKRVSEAHGFYDQQCTTPLASVRAPDECPPVEAILERAEPSGALCWSAEARLREIGAAYLDTAYQNASGQCSPGGYQPPNLFKAGPVINQRRFPAVARRGVGVGPVQLQRWFSPRGDPLPDPGIDFIRADSGVRCGLVNDRDQPDLSYCLDLEQVGISQPAFRDPSCQVPLGVQWLFSTPACRQQPLSVVAIRRDPGPPGVCADNGWELRPAGPSYQGPVYQVDNGRCVQTLLESGQDRVPYVHELGARQGWSGQPVIRRITE